jgi:alkylation response protein AidB-like acyl-CoA dehydrogenase
LFAGYRLQIDNLGYYLLHDKSFSALNTIHQENMNFDFSAEQELLREQARRFLSEHSGPAVVRAALGQSSPENELENQYLPLIWTTGAHHSDYGLIVTRNDAGVLKHKGLTCFSLAMN